jgi:hypothetical protein
MRKRVTTALLLMLLGPAALAAQTPEQRVEAARQRVLQAGIPVSLLESKVAEGRAKGVPMARIAAAVEARATALERARHVLTVREPVTEAELSVGADAVQSGVSDAVLAAVAERSPREQRAVAIDALMQLVQMGHAPEHALARVTEALRRGPEALMNLPAQARAQQRRGPPANVPSAGQGQGQGTPRGGPPATVPGQGQGPQRGKPPAPPGKPPGTPGGGPPGD